MGVTSPSETTSDSEDIPPDVQHRMRSMKDMAREKTLSQHNGPCSIFRVVSIGTFLIALCATIYLTLEISKNRRISFVPIRRYSNISMADAQSICRTLGASLPDISAFENVPRIRAGNTFLTTKNPTAFKALVNHGFELPTTNIIGLVQSVNKGIKASWKFASKSSKSGFSCQTKGDWGALLPTIVSLFVISLSGMCVASIWERV
eukprot:282324_1